MRESQEEDISVFLLLQREQPQEGMEKEEESGKSSLEGKMEIEGNAAVT